MPVGGRRPAPLWVQSVFVGTFILVSAGLVVSAVLWVGVPQTGIFLVFDGVIALLGFAGILLIVLGLRLRRGGLGPHALAGMPQDRTDRVPGTMRDDGSRPPRTKAR